jgi:diacylglycerol O-acyltransferase
MTTHPMTPVDAAWFHMDGPVNLAIMTGLILTREPLDFERVRAVYRARLPQFERFRQRVVEQGFPIATPHWQDMPGFNIDLHLHHVALPAPHDEAALRALVSDMASTPLDHAQPLWQVHVVDNVAGGSALVMRVHHCIADGTGMMTVIGKLFDTDAGAPVIPTDPGATPAQLDKDGLLAPALQTIRQTAQSALTVAGSAVHAVTHPRQTLAQAGAVLQGAGMLVGELLKTDDPPSPLKGEFGQQKRVAWSATVPIKDVKAIGGRFGAKVNDVLVAAVAGALRSYLKGRGVEVNHTSLRAMVPVDLRPPAQAGLLGNEFGLVILELPVGAARPAQRLARTKAAMDALKRSPEALATLMLFDIFGRGPKTLQDLSNRWFGSKCSLVLTNVAGPRETLYLAGVPIDRMMAWAPHPGEELGMTLSILSYRAQAALTVIGDARLVPDPEAITDLFHREFEALKRAAKPCTSRAKTHEQRPAATP